MKIKKGPWIVVGTKNVYSNPWIKVKADDVIRPDGKNGIFGVVTMKAGVSVLPLDNQGYVYLTKEFHYAVERETIETISGGIDGNEKPLVAAKRELKEETGMVAKKWINLGVVDPFTTVIKSPNYLFLAKNLTFSKANPEGTESIKVIKVKFDQALKWVLDSKITHSASATLILKVSETRNT